MKILMIASAVLAMSAGAALAADGAAQVRVTSSGLDLTQGAGAKAMLRRLDNAALSACGASKFSVAEMRRATRSGDCYKGAMDSAVSTLGAPAVTGLYNTDARAYAAR